MIRAKQVVFRLDGDLAQVVKETADRVNRSRSTILRTAVMLLAKLPSAQRRAAVLEYATRDIPPDAPARKSRGAAPRRSR